MKWKYLMEGGRRWEATGCMQLLQLFKYLSGEAKIENQIL